MIGLEIKVVKCAFFYICNFLDFVIFLSILCTFLSYFIITRRFLAQRATSLSVYKVD